MTITESEIEAKAEEWYNVWRRCEEGNHGSWIALVRHVMAQSAPKPEDVEEAERIRSPTPQRHVMSKGTNSTYRPGVGITCLISGPNCDDDTGYVFGRMTILWYDDMFVLYRQPGCWPVLNKWDHILCKSLQLP
jgi:hypothetical protein